MICPRCKAEYVDGITFCADCGIPLVDRLPDEPKKADKPPKKYRQLGSNFNAGEIAIIKSILDGAGIDYYFKGERFQTIHAQYVDPAILMVWEEQYKEAKKLLGNLKLYSN
jgi:hypothetical protein